MFKKKEQSREVDLDAALDALLEASGQGLSSMDALQYMDKKVCSGQVFYYLFKYFHECHFGFSRVCARLKRGPQRDYRIKSLSQ